MIRRLIIALAVFLPGYALADHEQIISDISTGVSMKILGPYESVPMRGSYPLTIEIKNDTFVPRTWSVRLESQHSMRRMQEMADLRVASGRTERFTLYYDIVETSTGGSIPYPPYVSLYVDGYGIERPTYSLPTRNRDYNAAPTPFLAFVGNLRSLANTLESEWKGSSNTKDQERFFSQYPELSALMTRGSKQLSFNGSEVSVSLLPSDWRGYLGVDQLWVAEKIWLELSAPVRDAIRTWMLQGGTLVAVSPSFGFELRQELALTRQLNGPIDSTAYGLGKIVTVAAAPETIGPKDVASVLALTGDDRTPLQATESNYVGRRGRTSLPSDGTISPLIPLGMIVYALLVGPFNVFVWSKKRRAMLYVTTPLMALSATVVLAFFILFGDGTGGMGNRSVAAFLSPFDRKLIVLQEQWSRSGLVVRRNFDLPEGAILRPIETSSELRGRRPEQRLEKIGNSYSGDWFNNRATDQHRLQSISSTRTRVELVRDQNNFAVRSGLGMVLKTLFYVDESGDVWTAENVSQGRDAVLTRSNTSRLTQYLTDESARHGPAIADLILRVRDRRGYFFGSTPDASALAIDTLSSIDWNKTEGFVTGLISTGNI